MLALVIATMSEGTQEILLKSLFIVNMIQLLESMLILKRSRCLHIPRNDMRHLITYDDLTELAKKHGQTMHGYINSNQQDIFEVFYPFGVTITYNELPSGHIGYFISD